MASDFEGYLETIAADRVAHQADTAAARRILSATGPAARSGVAPTLAEGIQILMGAPTIQLSNEAVGHALRGDQSALLPIELRRALLSWTEEVELLERQNDYLESVNADFYNFLVGRYPTRNLFTDFGSESRFDFDPESLLRDIRFESVVHNRGDASVLILDQARGLTDEVMQILSLIEGAR